MLPMDDGDPDGLPFLELRGNGRIVQLTEHIQCASGRDDPGTSTVLCLQLILIQRGETGACSLDCGGILRFFDMLCERALRLH